MTYTQKLISLAIIVAITCFFAGRWTAHAATITTILGTDTISSSRTTINDNFTNLNTDKLESTNLDTFAELDAIVADKSLVNLTDNQTFTGLILFTNTGTSTFGGGLRLTGGLSATQGIEGPFFNATSTSASTTLQGLELTRFNTSGTSTLGNGVVFSAGTIKLPSDICASATNGGVLTTDTDGTIICENDDSTAGGGGAEALSDLSDASLTSTTTGDMLYQASDGLFKNLAIGTGGFILSAVNGIPGWVSTSTFLLAEEIDTSAELAAIVGDETGTGALVFANSPTFVTPALGTPASGVATNLTALNATQLTTGTIPAARVGADHIDAITEIAAALKDGTGTCASGLLCLGGHTHPIASEVSGIGSGGTTFLATPSSANFASFVTGETGTGAVVFGTSPTISGPTLSGTVIMSGTGTSTSAGSLRLSGGIAANPFIETGVLRATSTAASSTVQGLTAARLNAQATSTIAGLRVVSGGLQVQGLDCSGLSNGGALSTDSAGNLVCTNDDSTAGGSFEYDWSKQSFGGTTYLAPTTTITTYHNNGLLATASSTFSYDATTTFNGAGGIRIGNGFDYLEFMANNGGAEVSTRDATRIRFNNQVRFDSDNFTINTPPLVFRSTAPDDGDQAKGTLIEWQQHFENATYDYGSTTKAYFDWAKGGESGAYPTFSSGSAGAKRVSWIGTHYDSPASTGEDIHQHLNLETVQADLSTLVTRLSISYGENTALVSFPNAEVQVHDDKPLYLSNTTFTRLQYGSASTTLLIDGANVQIGGGDGTEQLTIMGVNNSASGATLRFCENVATCNGLNFVYDSTDNQLELFDSAGSSNRFIFGRDSGNLQLISGTLNIDGTGTSTFDGGIQTTKLSTSASSTFDGGLHITAGGLKVTGLTSCDSVDTDANGTLRCGTDATGGAGSFDSIAWDISTINGTQYLAPTTTITTYHNNGLLSVASSTFTGPLKITGHLSASSTATSTFANGLRLDAGCFLLSDGTCAGSNASLLSSGTIDPARVGSNHIDSLSEISSGIKDGSGGCSTNFLCIGGHTHDIGTQVSGLGSNVATFLGTPSSANFASAVTDETGTGAVVFGTSPALTTPSIAGATLTGAINGSGATTFRIPVGASPTLNLQGAIALDTTSGNVRVATSTTGSFTIGGATSTIAAFGLASTSPELVNGGIKNIPVKQYTQRVVTGVICSVDAGTSVQIFLSDGTNDTNTITCTSTITQYAFTTNFIFNAYELMRLEVGTVTGAVDYLDMEFIGYRVSD